MDKYNKNREGKEEKHTKKKERLSIKTNNTNNPASVQALGQ